MRTKKLLPRPRKLFKKTLLVRITKRPNKLRSLSRAKNFKRRNCNGKRSNRYKEKDKNKLKINFYWKNKRRRQNLKSMPNWYKNMKRNKCRNRSENSRCRATSKNSSDS